MGLPYTCVQLGHIVKCLDELGSRWVWICQSENDEVTTTQGYSFFHSCLFVVCLGNLWHLSHMLSFTYSLFDIYAGTRQVWSVQQKSALRLSENSCSEAQAANKKWNSGSSAEKPVSCRQDLAKAWAVHQQAARQRSRVTSKLLKWHLSELVVTTVHCHDNSAEFQSLSVAWNYSLIFCIVLLLLI